MDGYNSSTIIETAMHNPEAVHRINAYLERRLDAGDVPETLRDAMRYAVLGGGKRIRPQLAYAAGELAGSNHALLDRAAAAVEFMHAYSLVHDDLPAMDDDALRHGQPSVHVRHGEATAILVGDALQALAFEVATEDGVPDAVARQWSSCLARAAGGAGMVGGQQLDLEAERRAVDIEELRELHRKKTGALIRAAVVMGAMPGNLSAEEMDRLDAFAGAIGLAFQIHDDVLDATVSTEQLGKPRGSDERQGKSTFVRLLGLDAARIEAERGINDALSLLDRFDGRADSLRALARYIVSRRF